MTDTLIIAALAIGCMIFVAFVPWLFRPRYRTDIRRRMELPPEPMEYQEPSISTRIWDGNINRDN